MSSEGFFIDSDIRLAQTPPGWVYGDPVFYKSVVDNIFRKSWQYVADSSIVRVPGQTHPFTLLEGSLNEPLLLTRDQEDKIHCLSNVCTHRGAIVCSGAGIEKSLVCRYHGRRFDLDGRFRFMPGFEKIKDFPSITDDLQRIDVDSWGGGQRGRYLFTSPDPLYRLQRLTAPMDQRVGWMPFDEFTFDPNRSRDYLIQANWALYVDNYLEGFHIPFVHASLGESLDLGQYSTELYEFSVLQLGVAKEGEESFSLPVSAVDYGRNIAAYYFWLFPNTMFNFYPWGLSINIVKPLSVDRTRISFLSYVWDDRKLNGGAGSILDRVEREDEVVVEAVQQGLRSTLYKRGRYSPSHERGVHHFHSLFAASV